MFLCGIDVGVYIHPYRIVRQMGLVQKIPAEDSVVQRSKPVKRADIESWAANWANRVFLHKPETLGSKRVSRAYVSWTNCLDSKERNRVRKDEKLDYDIDNLISQNSSRPSVHFRLGKRENGEGSSRDGSVFKRLKIEEPDCSVLSDLRA